MSDKLPMVLEEISRIREELGWPIMIRCAAALDA